MACYNAEPFIVSSVESVLRQTYKNLELIIVDDASNDKSLAIAYSLAKGDSRIKVFSLEKNSGAGAARNFAISKADGDWLAILDADDVFLPDKLTLQIELASKPDSNIVLIGTDSFEIDKDGNRFSIQKYPTNSRTLINNLVRQKRFPPHSSLMYKADAVKNIGGYDNRLCPSEDYNLWLRLSGFGSFASIPEPLVEYRHHITNISKANSGFEQLKFGFAAAVCHFLRTRNQSDPLSYTSVEDWDEFINWLSRRLTEEEILRYRHAKEEFRMMFFHRNNQITWIFKILSRLLFNPLFLWTFIKEKMFGTRLPEELAIEWIKHF